MDDFPPQPVPADAQPGSGDMPVPTDALPNFVVVDFVTLSEADSNARLTGSVSVMNVGEGEAEKPNAWFLVSTTSDFSTGYFAHSAELVPTAGGDGSLAPGEEEVFDVRESAGPLGSIDLALPRYGTYYARLWLNPDVATGPGLAPNAFEATHASAESNYDDNLSSTVSFEWPEQRRELPECPPDVHEENDSIEDAAPIVLDTGYVINTCDDVFDVFSVELVAGQVLELVTERTALSGWIYSVIAPDGSYPARRESAINTPILRIDASGTYYVAYQQIHDAPHGIFQAASFSLNTLR